MEPVRLFLVLKSIHVATVVITAALFMIRGYWLFAGSSWLRHPVIRVAPHVNDTILFASAMGLAWLLGQYPFVNGWLTAKFLALLAYIVLGHIALKRARSPRARLVAFVSALATLAYIVGAAVYHTPAPWRSLFA